MKAIVANVLFGSIFGCLGWANPALADLTTDIPSDTSDKSLVSATLPLSRKQPAMPQLFSSVDLVVKLDFNGFNAPFDYDWQTTSGDRSLSFPWGKGSYLDNSEGENLILGFQSTFWPSQKKQKYWGVTAVKLWGQDSQPTKVSGLNYASSPPALAAGSSTLTVSGGGNNSAQVVGQPQIDYSQEQQEFRGGVSYHHGVANHLTMGVGLVYDERLLGFTQLTYDSDILPIRTTISLLAKESEVNLHSHVRFQPASNFVVNYYHDEEQKFDLNWDVISGLTLLAKGDSENKSYSTGIKVAVRNDYLSVSATAALNRDRQLEWKLNTQIGRFKFIYSNDRRNSSSELNTNLLDAPGLGVRGSVFVKYQTREVKKESEEFMVWGGKLHSTKKVGQNKPYWTVNLGYGSGKHGKGLIAEGAIAVAPELFLKLNYQEISAVSDDAEIKLELSSD